MAVTRKRQNANTNIYTPGEILYICISHWHWFAISMLIMLGYAAYKIATTQPVYSRYCEVLIKSGQKGVALDEQMESFANMGVIHNTSNAYNEIYTFRATETIVETVRRLKLYVEYSSDGPFYPITLYGENLPVQVSFGNIELNETASMDIDITTDKKFKLYNFKGAKVSPEDKTVFNGSFEEDSIVFASTPLGDIILEYNKQCPIEETATIHANHIGLGNAVGKFAGRISYNLLDENGEIITISASDNSTERADDILNMLVTIYNENWIKDKNKAAEGTEKFINERLEVITAELDKVERDISTFKSDNQLPDLEAAAAINMAKESDVSRRIDNVRSQLDMGESILENVKSRADKSSLLPINSGINSANINSQIASYNTLMIERNNLVAKSNERTPAVRDMDLTLSSMRISIISSIETYLRGLRAQISSLSREKRGVQDEIAKNPEQTTFLASAEREQSIKEKIYLFLLQKREENQLSQTFTADKTRIITPPSGSLDPTAPKKQQILMSSLLIGLLLPSAVLVLKEVSNTRIRGRKDLENITAPIIGEIPHVGNPA
ncbi:MAG: chromosome partitioning protein ParA, partial [Bacteroidaceae bacterium]|nr:chromosome partitioning protein ParA [Bacteroidaceae bacterium]